jgi:hypothetical protein
MNAQIGSSDLARMKDQASCREFVLAALRCTCLRVRLVEKELEQIGTSLKEELISPNTALEWAEEVAPGCVGFIPTTVHLAGDRI